MNALSQPVQCSVCVVAVKPNGTRVLFSRASTRKAGCELIRALTALGLTAELDDRPGMPSRPGTVMPGGVAN